MISESDDWDGKGSRITASYKMSGRDDARSQGSFPRGIRDDGSRNRSQQGGPSRLEGSIENAGSVRSAEARAAHVERLARARTRSQTRAALPPTPAEEPLEGRHRGESEPAPATVGDERPDRMTLYGDALEAHRDQGDLTQRAALNRWLTAELDRRIPAAVEAQLTSTLRKIVEDHSRTLARSAVDEVVGRGPFWDTITSTVRDVTRAEVRAQAPPAAQPPSAAAEVLLPSLMLGNARSHYTQTGREAPWDGGEPDYQLHAHEMAQPSAFPPGAGRAMLPTQRHRRKAKDWGYVTDGSEASDAARDDTDSSDDDFEVDVRHLRRIRPLNDLFEKVRDYRRYRLHNRSGRYNAKVAITVSRAGKRMALQMKGVTFSGDDPIAVLNFLSRFTAACNQNGMHEGAALWCFQFFMTGTALAKVQTRIVGESGAADARRDEVLSSYPEVVNYLLRTYATNEVMAEAYADVTNFLQSSGMSETEYGDRLWRKALRCGNVFSDSWLKSLFAEGLLPAIGTQMRHHLTTHPRIAFAELTRYVEGMGTAYRGGKNYPATAGGRDRSGHRTGRRQRSLLLSEESSEPGFLEEVDVSSDRPLAMAVETAAFPSPPGTRSTYFTASPGSTVPRVGNSAWQTANTPLRGGDVHYWEPLGRMRAAELPAASAFRGRGLVVMGCHQMSELGFWPNGRRISNRDASGGATALGDGLETPRGRIRHRASVQTRPRGPRLGPSSSDPARLPVPPMRGGRGKTEK